MRASEEKMEGGGRLYSWMETIDRKCESISWWMWMNTIKIPEFCTILQFARQRWSRASDIHRSLAQLHKWEFFFFYFPSFQIFKIDETCNCHSSKNYLPRLSVNSREFCFLRDFFSLETKLHVVELIYLIENILGDPWRINCFLFNGKGWNAHISSS